INVLEYVALLINFAASYYYYLKHPDPTDPYPVLILYADNTASESWTVKGISGAHWMQAFSTKCRAHLAHYGCHIAEEVRRSNCGKQDTTNKSRANHFLKWVETIDLDQDPMLPHHDIQARNYLIACFAVSLVRGETLQGTNIRHATIRNYVQAVCRLHRDRDLPSPYGAPVDYISIVLKAVKKFEKQPNRREMIHDEMFHHIESRRSSFHEDSLEAALIDWLYLGRFVGYRGIEWCQKTMKTYLKIDSPHWVGPDSYAFVAEDFRFFNKAKQEIAVSAESSADEMEYVNVRFRKQKNDRNYEVIPYYKDDITPSFCPVRAALRIRQRALRLQVPTEEPLGVFHCTTGKYINQRCFITAAHVATFLQRVAQRVFHIKDGDKSLQRWTSHSLRVTACNLLHRQGFSDTYIQSRLRWRSNAFLDYLRNTLYHAADHTKALNIPPNNLP
ncbi:hypothetical protein ACHAXR_003476, partial [Thalassiosira sp. AJA248-18]